MSIYGAMYSGVSGLSAQSNAMGIISDNISNVNTVGYKGSTASFQTMVTQAATKTTYTPGGVGSRPLQGVDLQGLLQGTSNATDLAISGNGMFVVNESANPNVGDDMMFTRAGEFRPDENGDLRNAAGFYLQGWPIDDDGNLPAGQQAIGSVQTVNVSNLNGLPRPTTEMSIGANLPSSQDPTDPAPHHTSTATIFDSLGASHDITFDFTKTAANDWTVRASSPDIDFGGGLGATVNVTNAVFDGTGAPTTDLVQTLTIAGFAPGNGAATGQDVEIDLGGAGEFGGLTNFNSEFTGFTELNQNGLKFGNFTGTTVSEEGVVTAVFDNGRRKDIYQLPIAMFSNFNGLEERSGNAYLQTGESGDFLLTEAGTGGSGTVAPSALEQSTVDLAEEFTRMITTQRAYSASTKVITTSDEMLQELTQAVR
ncbi:flagellar hook protein FlgE [Rhodovibrio salinarum]|uniref:Flagellar hook protein FlgE n=1 Tax=Rhodovibrio salinarum TaxID=1087 RepID=A0A934QJ20_9PROT|nr:flagellar hook protein FlgE [Rhodovibrio salinarum]MBK1697702.1 flagellar hook protein FlgE [Rhodovibrio salinarum]